jgi:hypothetical protein
MKKTLFILLALFGSLEAKPLKVFILAGQSNMEGHASIETFDYIGDDPTTAPLLKKMRGADGKPVTCEKVWISYFTGTGVNNGEGFGKLTAGYGSRSNPAQDGGKIGPEFTFGITLEERLGEPVLLIKTAWGGKSLHTDFRPPSAGPYKLTHFQEENYPKQEGHGIPKDFEQWKADKVKETGIYYRLMMGHVKQVLADPKRVYPGYSPDEGYEIGGFVWFQGWNDMCDSHAYPTPKHGDTAPRFQEYSRLLECFIKDVRKDIGSPKMPFVIGVMGVDGQNPSRDVAEFRKAMAEPANLPEFKGNVVAVQTAPFWSEELGEIDRKRASIRQMHYFIDSKHKDHANANGLMTDDDKRKYLAEFAAKTITSDDEALWKRGASNAGYHYLGCGKTFALMGQAYAEAVLSIQPK